MENIVTLPGTLNIFQRLDNKSLCNARLVCQKWNQIILNKKFWWRRILKHEKKHLKFCKKQEWSKKGWKDLIKHVEICGNHEAVIELCIVLIENLRYKSAKTFSIVHYCAEFGMSNLLQILLEFLQDKDWILDFGWQPLPLYFALSYAAKEGHLDILKIFVKMYGPEVFVNFKKQYPDGRLSPLYFAERNEDHCMIEYLKTFPMP